jgi:hypothetical protein
MIAVSTRFLRVTGGILVLVAGTTTDARAASCTRAVRECTELVKVTADKPAGVLVYRTHPLDSKNENVSGAVLIIHGADRHADQYFRDVLAAAFLAGRLEDTLIVSPRFASRDQDCQDQIAGDELNWRCDVPGDWRTGGSAIGDASTTSYDVIDAVLRKLSRPAVFPNLKHIVVAGFSAGGEFLTHYEMSNQVHEQLGIPLTYVVGAASLYTYMDGRRPFPPTLATVVASALGPDEPWRPSASSLFVPFSDASVCPTLQDWPFGLNSRKGYTARVSEDQLRKQLVSRPTTYLLGSQDTLPLAGFFASCAAMAQGSTRLARGLAWGVYVNQLGAKHNTVVAPN